MQCVIINSDCIGAKRCWPCLVVRKQLASSFHASFLCEPACRSIKPAIHKSVFCTVIQLNCTHHPCLVHSLPSDTECGTRMLRVWMQLWLASQSADHISFNAQPYQSQTTNLNSNCIYNTKIKIYTRHLPHTQQQLCFTALISRPPRRAGTRFSK